MQGTHDRIVFVAAHSDSHVRPAKTMDGQIQRMSRIHGKNNLSGVVNRKECRSRLPALIDNLSRMKRRRVPAACISGTGLER